MPSETALERIVVRTSSGFEVHSAVARPSLVRQIIESWVSFVGRENDIWVVIFFLRILVLKA